MADWFESQADGATPLDEEERHGLLASWVATREDLNVAEQENITTARLKWRRRRLSVHAVLDDSFAKSLHRDMFGDVWDWAGRYRTTDRNIGIPWWDVDVAVRDLMEDARLWLLVDHPMAVDQAACRFHHRLVQIHPFPNGNGRHSREMTDLLLRSAGADEFSWGSGSLLDAGDTRTAYVAALRAADQRDFEPLQLFVRS